MDSDRAREKICIYLSRCEKHRNILQQIVYSTNCDVILRDRCPGVISDDLLRIAGKISYFSINPCTLEYRTTLIIHYYLPKQSPSSLISQRVNRCIATMKCVLDPSNMDSFLIV